jgi:hypothetical protein
MLVKELIEKLSKFNPEEDIRFHCSIESGMSVSVCQTGEVGIDFMDNIDPETGNEIEDGPLQILVLYINGEETYYN